MDRTALPEYERHLARKPAPMKFQPDKSNTLTVTGYDRGWIAVDKQRYEHSLVVCSNGTLQPWNCNSFADSGDFVGLTKRINGGVNGLADRQAHLVIAQKALGI